MQGGSGEEVVSEGHTQCCIALCGALLGKGTRGGLVVVGGLNLGGSIEPLYNVVSIAELAIEKGASAMLVPVSCRKQMIDLPDDLATKLDVTYYSDTSDSLLKSIRSHR